MSTLTATGSVELITNGGFTGGTTDWTAVDQANTPFSYGMNNLIQTYNLPLNAGGYYQGITLDTSKTYTLQFTLAILTDRTFADGLNIWIISPGTSEYYVYASDETEGDLNIEIVPADWQAGVPDPLGTGIDSLQIYGSGDNTYTEYSITDISLSYEVTISLDYQIRDSLQTSDTGSIRLSNITGSGNYTFSWSNGETTQNISDIPAGEYTLELTDVTQNVTITYTFTVYNRCPAYDFTQIKVFAYQLQCCLADMTLKYIRRIKAGSEIDKCLENQIKYGYNVLNFFLALDGQFGHCSADCTMIDNYVKQISKFCHCNCCESDQDEVQVHYNENTNEFDNIS